MDSQLNKKRRSMCIKILILNNKIIRYLNVASSIQEIFDYYINRLFNYNMFYYIFCYNKDIFLIIYKKIYIILFKI